MSTAAVIGHLAMRWRPLAAGLGDPQRFGGLSTALAGRLLGAGIDAGTSRGEVTCIRAIEVRPVRVAADVTDEELLGRLTGAIAASVEAALSGARAEQVTVLRYRSRAHAALDVAVSHSRGDHRREWAWRQLGLWPEPGERLAAALGETPWEVPALLSAAAEAGALGSLASLLGPAGLDGIVRAAWRAQGRALLGWPDLLGPRVPAPDDAGFAQVIAILTRSALGRRLLSGAQLPAQSAAAASAAALLDGEPALALWPAARITPLVTAAVLLSLGRRGGHAVGGTGPASPAPGPGGTQPGAASPGAAAGPPSAAAGPPGAAGAPADDVTALSAVRADEPGQQAGAAVTGLGSGAEPSQRAGVPTRFGGLPCLLHLAQRCGLPERVANGELADAGLGRVLYEIGARVLGRLVGPGRPPDPEDTALACLCGQAPAAGWRSAIGAGDLGAHASELADGEAERLIAALRAALEPSELSGSPEAELLTAVCLRAGRVTADPGWIDVHLKLAEVSTDVRRAGLDLDLGYLPWLGCVVRFVYD